MYGYYVEPFKNSHFESKRFKTLVSGLRDPIFDASSPWGSQKVRAIGCVSNLVDLGGVIILREVFLE